MRSDRDRVREGELPGGLPYLAVGRGAPLVFLGGSTPEHRNPRPGLEQTMTLRMIRPLAAAGFEVFFVSRWPGLDSATTSPMSPISTPRRSWSGSAARSGSRARSTSRLTPSPASSATGRASPLCSVSAFSQPSLSFFWFL